MYVVIKGDFRFGVTDVIGPFLTEDAIWASALNNAEYGVSPHEIYPVIDSGLIWTPGSTVSISFDDFANGKIRYVMGPHDARTSRITVQSVSEYLGIETEQVPFREHIEADFTNGSLTVTDECVDVPAVEEKDILTPKTDILREVVVSKQMDRWGLDNAIVYIDPRGWLSNE